MNDWEDVRDWEIVEAVSDLGHDSYSFVGRDIFLENGSKADFIRYRPEGHLMEVRYYWSDRKGAERREVMSSLESVRDLLLDEGFRPRSSISRVDGMKPGYIPDIQGDYYVDSDSDVRELKPVFDSITPEERSIDQLEVLECKK